MAITDTLTGTLNISADFNLARVQAGGMTGQDRLINNYAVGFTNGTGVSQGTCWLTGTGTVTFGAAITLSLADSVNPLSTFSSDVPTADPEALKIRVLIIKNLDATNFIKLDPGVNAWTEITGQTKIQPGGTFVYVAPSGGVVINDGVDDEVTVQADTGDCSAVISIIYG